MLKAFKEFVRERWLRFASEMRIMFCLNGGEVYWTFGYWITIVNEDGNVKTKLYRTFREYEQSKFLQDLKK